LGLETHVKHTISLIEDQVGDTTEVSAASLQHVNQTTGGSNANLDTTGQVTNLRALGDTTVDTGVANTRGLAELADLSLNLNSQLTSRSQNQNDRAITGGQERLGVDVNNSGKTVRQRLSGTGLGDTDNITTGESHRPALRLDGSWALETLGLDLRQDVGREASLIEGLDGARDTTASDGHLVLLTESLNFGIGAGRDFGVLLVEGLLELGECVHIYTGIVRISAVGIGHQFRFEAGELTPVLGLETSTQVGHAVTTTAAAVAAATTTVAAAAAIATSI
jgi:hypothetical protein